MTRFNSLADWLRWQETLHPREIELGLDRVRAVADRLDLLQPACPVVIVGGTNGKGSTLAYLEAIYSHAGYRT
ncbi:MAG TPA: bifunctional tetrahydrofolate synthase/dihydrofolate synthase, partial [Thiohalobacter sp.]|nr:bifunctional tetrahydrofolate synthase/dihydrofolate synthase [Thiohalobacter sp.]